MKYVVDFVEKSINKLKERSRVFKEEDLTLKLMNAMKVVKDMSFRKKNDQLNFAWMAGK